MAKHIPLKASNTAIGYFLSDLHLLSPRSMWERQAKGWEAEFRQAQLVVLGGDIFDFRWAYHGSHLQTLKFANDWIRNLIRECPDTHVAYVLGNHDSHPDLVSVLETLARDFDRFCWDSCSLLLGDCLFCHGDMLDARGGGERLLSYRAQFQHDTPPSKLAHRAYDVAVAARLHRAVPILRHRPTATCQRLSDYLWTSDSESMPQVRRVFFGHTHVPIHGIELDRIQFFNPGAAMKHMRFEPIRFEVNA